MGGGAVNPPPACDSPSGCCLFTGPWTVSPSHVASGRCFVSAAAAGALAGVVSVFAEPSSWCAGAVLDAAFARQRRPVVGMLGLCWLLWGSFDPPPPSTSGAPLKRRQRTCPQKYQATYALNLDGVHTHTRPPGTSTAPCADNAGLVRVVCGGHVPDGGGNRLRLTRWGLAAQLTVTGSTVFGQGGGGCAVQTGAAMSRSAPDAPGNPKLPKTSDTLGRIRGEMGGGGGMGGKGGKGGGWGLCLCLCLCLPTVSREVAASPAEPMWPNLSHAAHTLRTLPW